MSVPIVPPSVWNIIREADDYHWSAHPDGSGWTFRCSRTYQQETDAPYAFWLGADA